MNMQYVRADKQKALAAGFSAATHNVRDGMMTLTAKEVMCSPRLTGTLAQRLAAIGGTTFEARKVSLNRTIKNNKTWH